MRFRNRKPVLDALRRHIAESERLAPKLRPAPSLGVTAGALPDLEPGGLHEFLSDGPSDFPAALGFVFASAARIIRIRSGPVVWVFPPHQTFREGSIYPAGLPALGVNPERIILVRAPKLRNILWTIEESLGCSSLAAVIGALPEGRGYDFTASRRLALRAAQSGVSALLLWNCKAAGAASAAATRWRISAESSAPLQHAGQAKPGLGPPRWRVCLVKSRKGTLGDWRVEWDHETFSFRLAAPLADRAALRTPIDGDNGAREGWAAAS